MSDSSGAEENSPGELEAAIAARLDRYWSNESTQLPNSPVGAHDGVMIGQYRIGRYLGAGAFGVVYEADDSINQRTVALKIPRPAILVDAQQRKRFFNESELVSRLSHSGIIKVYDAIVDGPAPFIATEFCDGPDLSVWLESRQNDQSEPVGEKEAALFAARIADAIGYAHQQGISHRDLKPANILLARTSGSAGSPEPYEQDFDAASLKNYTPMVADFGLGKLVDPTLADTRSSVLIGTPIYMAPEQMEESGPVLQSSGLAASDIYSIGVMLFELLSGKSPIPGQNYFEVLSNIKSAPRRRLSEFRTDLSRSMQKVCSTALNRNPAARYETAECLAADLRRVAEGKAAKGRQLSPLAHYRFWHQQRNWLQIAGWYSMFYCLLIMVWFGVTAIGYGFFSGLTRAEYLSMVPTAATVFFGSLLVPCIFAVCCIAGKFWAAWAGALINIPKMLATIPGMLGQPVAFREYYQDYSPYLCFTVHLFFFIFMSSQLVLYIFAIQSTRRRKKKRRALRV